MITVLTTLMMNGFLHMMMQLFFNIIHRIWTIIILIITIMNHSHNINDNDDFSIMTTTQNNTNSSNSSTSSDNDTTRQHREEMYGWTAALISMLAFGSFGVAIKSKRSQSVNIDPMVFQSYKTLMCFITSILLLIFNPKHVTLQFTPWGIVSGLFWVPG